MSWAWRIDERALKELRKLGPDARRQIVEYLDQRVAGTNDPRAFGKAWKGNLAGLLRYRIGDYRVICQIQDGELVVLVVADGHRRDIYG